MSRSALECADISASAAGRFAVANLRSGDMSHSPQRLAIRYLDQLGGLETAAPCSCSCNAGSRRLLTICSTNAASDRGKMNEYFGPFPAAGEITRFSERKPGS